MKKVVVLGAGGFIGSHLVSRLKREGYYVIAADLKYPEYSETKADEFLVGDLRSIDFVERVVGERVDILFQLAADMGGAGYIFTGEHDADVMRNSSQINLNIAVTAVKRNVGILFYSSSACVYPEFNQTDPNNPMCAEDSVYPAQPDSEYGWEKLFGERLFLAYKRNYNLNVKIARFHNIYGPEGAWNNGKEKAPAALCRKVLLAEEYGNVEVWGDGKQTRSFLYIDDCIDAMLKLVASHCTGPYNIGSEEMVSINELVGMIAEISGKKISIKNISGPEGVRGRCSDNTKIIHDIGWTPEYSLKRGMEKTYHWIREELTKNKDNLK